MLERSLILFEVLDLLSDIVEPRVDRSLRDPQDFSNVLVGRKEGDRFEQIDDLVVSFASELYLASALP